MRFSVNPQRALPPIHHLRVGQQLQEARAELALFDLQDQVVAQSGGRSSANLGLQVPALGLLGGMATGVALSMLTQTAFPVLASPALGLALALAYESREQAKVRETHFLLRQEKLDRIQQLTQSLRP